MLTQYGIHAVCSTGMHCCSYYFHVTHLDPHTSVRCCNCIISCEWAAIFGAVWSAVFVPLYELVRSLPPEKLQRWDRLWMVSDRRVCLLHPLVYSHPVTGMKVQFCFLWLMIFIYYFRIYFVYVTYTVCYITLQNDCAMCEIHAHWVCPFLLFANG